MHKIAILLVVVLLGALASVIPTTAAATSPDSPAAAQARLDQLTNQLDHANGNLDAANLKLAADAKKEQELGSEIASLARLQYKRPTLLIQFFEAASFSQVLGDLTSDRLIADKERVLLKQARDLRKQDNQARDQQALQQATIASSRTQALAILNQAVTEQNAYNAQLRLRAAALVATPLVVRSGPVGPARWSGGGAWPNRFTFGYCTWYVATKRYIPWLGNAIDWWPNARAYGYAEGQAPRVGAVMVTRESGYGHVAYVEAVNPDGSWMVSEMNFVGWDRVSTRTVHPGQVPLVGFIY